MSKLTITLAATAAAFAVGAALPTAPLAQQDSISEVIV